MFISEQNTRKSKDENIYKIFSFWKNYLLKTKNVQLCMLIRFFCQGNEKDYAQQNSMLLLLFFSLPVYLFSYSFWIHYHPPLCILTCYYHYFLLTKDDLILSSHTVRESLSTSHTSQTTLSSMYVFFFALLFSLSMSILTCSDSYKREEEIQQASAARG